MGNKNVQAQVKVHDRRLQVLELRKKGMSYMDIGNMLGISEQTAYNDVKIALKFTLQEATNEIRTLELQRLDSIWAELWPLRSNLQTVDRLIRITEQRAKILGIYAPTKVAPTNPDGTEEFGANLTPGERLRRIEALMKQVAGEKFSNEVAEAFGDRSEPLDEVVDIPTEEDDSAK